MKFFVFFFLTINIVYSFIRRSFSSPLILLPPSVSSSFLLSVGHPWSIQALWRHAPLTSQHLVSSRQLHTHSYTHAHTHTHTHSAFNILSTLKTCSKVSFFTQEISMFFEVKSLIQNIPFWSSRMRKTPCISVVSTSPLQEKTITLCLALQQNRVLNSVLEAESEQVVREVRAWTSHWPPPYYCERIRVN